VISGAKPLSKEAPMGWSAILLVLIFVGVIAGLNHIEFGRFD
jgi:hypothetical protein